MPDKIWVHKDTKYSTADEVFGYQYEFAQEIECEGIENFVEYVPVDAFIDKACEWLEEHLLDFWSQRITNTDYFIEDFKKAMNK